MEHDGWPAIGDVLDDKVEIRAVIGRGGMGTVFDGFHRRTGRRVAVKVLREEIGRDAAACARLLQEALACGRVQHPNVVDVLDASITQGRPYVVMERLEGESLAQRIERTGPLPVWEVLDVMAQVLAGLAAAHANGIVHRDLKPDNIFLARSATGVVVAKVVDFGISKVTEVDSLATTTPTFALTAPGTVLGTAFYMSPEQARGHKDLDARSDVYSAGAVIFHALTGRPPFVGDSYNAILAQILLDEAPDVCAFRPDVTRGLARVVARSLAKKPEDRFASAAELGHVLARQTRVLQDAAGLITDLVGFSAFSLAASLEDVEQLLEAWERAHAIVAQRHGGVLRQVMGDGMVTTFPSVAQAVRAWMELAEPGGYAAPGHALLRFRAGVARGELRIVRSALFGIALNDAHQLSVRAPAGSLGIAEASFAALPAELRVALQAEPFDGGLETPSVALTVPSPAR